MSVEKRVHAASGWGMLGLVILGYLVSPVLMLWSIIMLNSYDATFGGLLMLLFSCLVFTAAIIASCGFFTLQPGQARVCVLFGKYVGTVRDEGFRWANPFYSRNLGRTGRDSGGEGR